MGRNQPFFDEEIFGLIEIIFEKHIPSYDHYNMNDADSESWSNIISELKELSIFLESANKFTDIIGKLGFVFGGTRDYFQNNFQLCKAKLYKMINELVAWAELNIEKHGYIAVLGI